MLRFEQNNFLESPDRDSLSIQDKKLKGKAVQKSSGRWTKEEHQKFVDGLKKFGKNWKHIEEYVGTRNGAQVRSHAQKFFNRLGKEALPNFELKDLQAAKTEEEIFRKTSGYSLDTNCSDQDNENQDNKLSQPASPLEEEKTKTEPKDPNQSDLVSVSISCNEKGYNIKSSDFLQKVNQNKPEEGFEETSSSLFHLLISKMQTCNNQIAFLKLTDILNISSASENGFSYAPVKSTELASNSFRLHPTNIMGDDCTKIRKLNKLRNPSNVVDPMEFGLPTKKIKVN